jgi:hypothetical protein
LVKTLSKFGLLLLGVCLLSAAPVFADSTTTFTFIGTLGDLPSPTTFTAGSLSLVATGYLSGGVSTPGVSTDMWAKNGGPNEQGLGIASEFQHEIAGTQFIQLDLTNILAANPSSIVLSVQSIQAGENYNVWASNSAGMLGTEIGMNQSGATFNVLLPTGDNFVSLAAGTGNILLDDVDVTTPTPEPSSAGLLLFGLAALVGAGTLGKKFIP